MTTKINHHNISNLANTAVNWQSVKTSSFTAVAGEGYFIDTTSGVITMTLPASPNVGDTVVLNDIKNQFPTNNLTVARNGSNLEGAASDVTLTAGGTNRIYVYSGATNGWISVNEDGTEPTYVAATGGTETTSGNFKIHTFTSSGCFTVSCLGNPVGGGEEVSYLVVAGGGGSGQNHSGGAGAGGYREGKVSSDSYSASPLAAATGLTVSASTYPITVGGGGSGALDPNNGANSVFSTITSTGGGASGSNNGPGCFPGHPGGSGGGAKSSGTAGSGNTPPVSPPQGNNGGSGSPSDLGQGGGGGAGAAGANGGGGNGGNGGNGLSSSITGSPVTRAGGGGANSNSGTCGTGGTGGGGNASQPGGDAGTANTGGGAGGGGTGANGGSGIVIIRYQYQ